MDKLNTYTIDITETLKKSVEVQATDYYYALDLVEEMYNDGKIILTADDFENVNFNENLGSAIARNLK